MTHRPDDPPPSILAAALRYAVIVFAAGFLLGTIRVRVTAPMLGETGAVIAELPFMLLASIMVAHQTLARHGIRRPVAALAIGLLAFLLLMLLEMIIAWPLADQHPDQWALALVRTPGWIGLLGQIAFAFIPLIDLLLNRGRPKDPRRDLRRPPPPPR